MEVDRPKRKLERDLEVELGDDYTLDLQSKSTRTQSVIYRGIYFQFLMHNVSSVYL